MSKVTLFSQIISLLPTANFRRIIQHHHSDKHSKGLSTRHHLISMLFCHLAKADSIRDVVQGMKAMSKNIVHLGIDRVPSKSSIAYMNKHRSWEVFRDFYYELQTHLQSGQPFERTGMKRLKRKVFILDSTTVPLSLQAFDWAHFRSRKGAVKLHTLLDYDGCLPAFIDMTEGKQHDIQAARTVNIPSGSVLVADRAYLDFKWLNDLDSTRVYFVIRAKSNLKAQLIADYAINGYKATDIISDRDICLKSPRSAEAYPGKLRLVRVWDSIQQKELTFLTNNFDWQAKTVADLYKSRWEIEVFFKQVKQNLKIKSFIGTSPNAVLIQVWTAMIVILLLKYLKQKAAFNWHLSNLVTFLRVSLFLKLDLYKWLDWPSFREDTPAEIQLSLFTSNNIRGA
ncbi:IS4 family transposase [Roseivirga sp. BDSF3-8]|uniref:IS4 family transposase n=1 Tax=Roseivirga sp. BDSF3-8 TaxID=3241598 RepID=UPI00353187A2